MELEQHGGAGVAGRLKRARAEQRQHVVHVHDLGAELARGGSHVVLVPAAA